LGTPTHAYNSAGEKIWERELDIYGAVKKEIGSKGFIPQLYQGQYIDEETGLAYNRFRYYDNESGNYLSLDPIRLLGGMNFYNYVNDTNSWLDEFGLAGGMMNGATATINAGNNSVRLPSKTPIHSEMRGLGELSRSGALQGQDVVIKDVIGHFPGGVSKTVGVCAECRANMFEHLIDGGAKSITIPETRGGKVIGQITIHSDNFKAVQADLKSIIDKFGKNKGVGRSNAAYDALKTHSH
jgi:RHS repeat-associated protein